MVTRNINIFLISTSSGDSDNMLPSYKDWKLRFKILFAAVVPFLLAVVISIPFITSKSIENAESQSKAFVDELSYSTTLAIKTEIDRIIRETALLSHTINSIATADTLNQRVLNAVLRDLFNMEKELKAITVLWFIDDTADQPLSEDIIRVSGRLAYVANLDAATYDDKFVKHDFDALVTTLMNANTTKEPTFHDFLFPAPNEVGPKHVQARIVHPNYTEDTVLKFLVIIDYVLLGMDDVLKDLTTYNLSNISITNSADQPLYQHKLHYMSTDAEVAAKSAESFRLNKFLQSDTYDSISNSKIYNIFSPINFNQMPERWTLSLSYSLEGTRNEIYQNMYLILVLTSLCFLIGVSVSIVTAKNIANPITEISDALEQISSGSHNHPLPFVDSNDEVGHLSRSAHIFKQNSKELVIAKLAAEEANVAKTEFLANMSHELRTPMHAMLSYSQLGLSKVEDKESKLFKYFTNIYHSGERLLGLLNNLLDLAKLESGTIEYKFQPHDIVLTVNEVIKELQSLSNAKRLTVTVLNNLVDSNFIFDNEKITQVFVNLLSNAIKFSPQDGHVTVTLTPQDHDILIEIADQGIGVPADELNSIFDKFIQSSKTNKGSGGTGLGLSIASSIVAAHQGKIWAENLPEYGAIFKVLLPTEHTIKAEE